MKRAKKSGFIIKKKREEAPQVIEDREEIFKERRRILKEKEKKSKKRKKYAAIFSVSFVAIIIVSLIVLGIGGLFENPVVIEEIEPVDEVSGKVNVLILGVDKEGLRTDTIIVASYDANEGIVNMISIPRDTRMYIGSRYQKINAAHAITGSNGKIKGPNGTIDAVTRITGIPINYYVEFSFNAFRETIDALGGVYFDVPQSMKYSDPTQGLKINLSKGYQLLDGDKAEQLVRFRRYPEGDIKRVHVQQDFIKAVAEQKLNAQIVTKLPDLYKALSNNVKTNFRLADVIKYANSLVNIDLDNIIMHQLPGQYSGSEYSASYWLPDMKETKLLIQNTFGYESKDITSGKPLTGAVYGKTTTEILNPEDVIVLEQDKHKPPVEKKETKESDDDEEDDDIKVNKKTTKTDSESDKEEENSEDDNDNEVVDSEIVVEEPDDPSEPVKEPEVPEIKPIEEINSSDNFVRPGAN